MGRVYLAQDHKHDRQVAVTMLDPPRGAASARARLAHQIQTAARLQHPHILPLLEFGEWADAIFYVTPFVDGESLRLRLDREPQLAVSDVLTIAQEIVGALAR